MPKRDPFDYFGCPEYMIVVTRWDGKGTEPKELYRGYVSECTWSHAAETFACRLRKLIRGSSRLAPDTRQRKGVADADARA